MKAEAEGTGPTATPSCNGVATDLLDSEAAVALEDELVKVEEGADDMGAEACTENPCDCARSAKAVAGVVGPLLLSWSSSSSSTSAEETLSASEGAAELLRTYLPSD